MFMKLLKNTIINQFVLEFVSLYGSNRPNKPIIYIGTKIKKKQKCKISTRQYIFSSRNPFLLVSIEPNKLENNEGADIVFKNYIFDNVDEIGFFCKIKL